MVQGHSNRTLTFIQSRFYTATVLPRLLGCYVYYCLLDTNVPLVWQRKLLLLCLTPLHTLTLRQDKPIVSHPVQNKLVYKPNIWELHT